MALVIIYYLILMVVLNLKCAACFRCDRRPYGSMTQSSAADGRFKLSVIGTDDTYIPGQVYTVQISETDAQSQFTAFMISAEGDTRQDPNNPRKWISLSPGVLKLKNRMTAKYSVRCSNSIEQAVSSAKSSVEVYWQAPLTNNGCVTLRAMVAENEEIWYEDGTPLTQRLCEDLRQPDDVTPQLNDKCEICDEAKYEVKFTGVWSRNTHPNLYPENDWIPRYSDLVGASHAVDYVLWSPGSLASEGVRGLAEHANSSILEAEVLGKIGDGVRTLIKGKGHGFGKMSNPTYAFFRTDNTNHLFTAAVALYPSPDWFLGVSRFELCQEDKTWLDERELNLYPWDAGTDDGVSYESPNMETLPQDIISRLPMSSYDRNSPFYNMDMNEIHPFGKLHIKLIRTYHKECEEETTDAATTTTDTTTTESVPEDDEEKPSEPEEPSSEAPILTDPDSSQECPISEWQEWTPCDGVCKDGKVVGYKWRERYHLVDGVPVEKYDPDADPSTLKEVPKICKNLYDDFDETECEDDCSKDEDKNEVNVIFRVDRPPTNGMTILAQCLGPGVIRIAGCGGGLAVAFIGKYNSG